jgi:hypothetical protein
MDVSQFLDSFSKIKESTEFFKYSDKNSEIKRHELQAIPKEVKKEILMGLPDKQEHIPKVTHKTKQLSNLLIQEQTLTLKKIEEINRVITRHKNKKTSSSLSEYSLKMLGGETTLNWTNEILNKYIAKNNFEKFSFSESDYQPNVSIFNNLVRVPMCKLGSWKHSSYGVVSFDLKDFDQIIKNFNENHTGYIPSLYFGHPEAPEFIDGEAKRGNLKKLQVEGQELIGYFEPTNSVVINALNNGEFDSASVDIRMNAVSKKTGKKIGALLTGVALTNKPFIPDLNKVSLISATSYLNSLSLSEQITCADPAIQLGIKLNIVQPQNITEEKMSKTIFDRLKGLLEEYSSQANKSATETTKTVEENTSTEIEAENLALTEEAGEVVEDTEKTADEKKKEEVKKVDYEALITELKEKVITLETDLKTGFEAAVEAAVKAASTVPSEFATLAAKLDLIVEEQVKLNSSLKEKEVALTETESKLSNVTKEKQALLNDLKEIALSDTKEELVASGIAPHAVNKYVDQLFSTLSLSDAKASDVRDIALKMFSYVSDEHKTDVGVQHGSQALSEEAIAEAETADNPFEIMIKRLEKS